MDLDWDRIKQENAERKRKEDNWNQYLDKIQKEDLEKQGIIMTESSNKEDFFKKCDNYYAMSNSSATILYLFIMFGGSIFNDRWWIWIAATIIFFKFITRHVE